MLMHRWMLLQVNGHGSHCAGIVGGTTVGIAPEANIFGMKILDDSGLGSFGGMIQALNWVITNTATRSQRAVVSMSLNGSTSSLLLLLLLFFKKDSYSFHF